MAMRYKDVRVFWSHLRSGTIYARGLSETFEGKSVQFRWAVCRASKAITHDESICGISLFVQNRVRFLLLIENVVDPIDIADTCM